ncbi:MAG: bifunctional 4-hydroxy-2-oxoglutarate aldolase/2-dehydro-3-deoxy-phosphogluconate aldolase [Clostridia bacterium]|nr:bifunctional 4-hydroxy-2-oxoglutarate aldolase/2-dehydro-3-deoxy-phosphogluconate aldolase [Clostridia bacterium]
MKNLKELIKTEHLIVIVRGVRSEQLLPLAEAMYEGGVRLLEITYSANGKVSDEETAKNINTLCRNFEGRMQIGAGTVLTEKQVMLTRDAGGKYIISPNCNEKIIKATKEAGLLSIPAAYTPTEIEAAYEAGADFVKLFPVTSLGPSYVKAVRGPLCQIPLLAVGGVDLSNLADYAKAGVCGFGIGGNIIDKKALEAGDYKAITELAGRYVSAIKEFY